MVLTKWTPRTYYWYTVSTEASPPLLTRSRSSGITALAVQYSTEAYALDAADGYCLECVSTSANVCSVDDLAPILPVHLHFACRTGASALQVPGEILRYGAEAICLYLQRMAPQSHAPFQRFPEQTLVAHHMRS